MRPLYVINDVHAGAIRSGGTTPATSIALRHATLDSFRALLAKCVGGDLLINGDLFDAFMVPFTDLWAVVEACVAWCGEGCHLYAGKGNHDQAKNTFNMSSFDLFCKMMAALTPNFHAVTEPTLIPQHKAYVIPHMANQDLFDEALKAMPKCRVLFLHANFDNKFAVEADHSLNVSPEQAEAAPCEVIVFGHEHQRKTALNGKVVVVGNQIPTSVADCLGNDAKYLLKIGEVLEHLPVWEAKDDFLRADWRSLSEYTAAPQRFIRVEGDATSAEASQVVSAISKFRSKSPAFVVTNAVAIDGVQADDDLKLNLDSAKSFDVLAALVEVLDEGFERDTVTNIIRKHNVQTTQAD